MSNINDIFNDQSKTNMLVEVDFTPVELGLMSVLLRTELLFETLETIQGTVDYGRKYADANIPPDMKKALVISDVFDRFYIMNTELISLLNPKREKKIARPFADFLLFLVRDIAGTLEFNKKTRDEIDQHGPAIIQKLITAGAHFDAPKPLEEDVTSIFGGPIGLA